MLSLTCTTAIRAVIYLASIQENGGKAGMLEVAKNINASEHTVGKLLQILVKEAVINSVKGPNGGFYITPKQLRLPLMAVVHAIDGKDVFKTCGLGFSKCSGSHPCPIHHDYKEVRDWFEAICRNRSLMDLCVPVHEGLAHLFG